MYLVKYISSVLAKKILKKNLKAEQLYNQINWVDSSFC